MIAIRFPIMWLRDETPPLTAKLLTKGYNVLYWKDKVLPIIWIYMQYNLIFWKVKHIKNKNEEYFTNTEWKRIKKEKIIGRGGGEETEVGKR